MVWVDPNFSNHTLLGIVGVVNIMVNTSSFGQIEIVILLVVALAAGGVIAPMVTTATEGQNTTDDTRSQATEIDSSGTVTAEIAPDETNWYAVDLNEGEGFTAQVHPDSADSGLDVALYGSEGVPVRSPGNGGDGGSDRQASSTVVERSGTHYVKVDATGSSHSGPVSYELSVSTTQLDQHDPNEHQSQAVPVTLGTTVTGVMTGYDQEYFSVEASSGDSLSVETTANGGAIETVTVSGPDGEQIHGASDGNVDGVQLPKDGQYTIHLAADLETTETLEYSFQATTNAEQTNSSDTPRITPGTAVQGTTTSTATTHTVNLTEGDGLSVALTHNNRTDHSESLSFSISNPDGTEVGTVPADSRGAYRTTPGTTTAVGGVVAEQTGTYTIAVTGTENANYSLSVETEQLDEHDPNEQPSTATAIDSNTTTSGVLSGYDRDVYAVNLQSDQTITVSSTGEGGFESALWAAGPDTSDQSPNSQEHSFGADTITGTSGGTNLTFTANQTGTYYIKVAPHPSASSASTFFKSMSYTMSTAVSNDVSTLNVSTGESSTITPTTITETTNTTVAPNNTLTAPITTAPNRSTSSPFQSNQPTTEQSMVNVGTGALFALGSVFAAFVGVGALEWWRQSGRR